MRKKNNFLQTSKTKNNKNINLLIQKSSKSEFLVLVIFKK